MKDSDERWRGVGCLWPAARQKVKGGKVWCPRLSDKIYKHFVDESYGVTTQTASSP